MAEQYHVDLERFSLKKFRHILETGDALPSHRILKDEIAERFGALESMGISNLQELVEALSTKKKIERFSQASGLSQDYLEILKRRTRIYTPRPIALQDFPGIDPKYVKRLADLGIKQTKQLFERARSRRERAELSRLSNVPGGVLLELVKLSDLARAGYVGPIFARLIYETGADTLDKLSRQSPETLYEKLSAINNKQKLARASFLVKDVASCIEIAQALPKVIEY